MKKYTLYILTLFFILNFTVLPETGETATTLQNQQTNTTYPTYPTSRNESPNTATIPIDQANTNPLQNFPPTNYFNDLDQGVIPPPQEVGIFNQLVSGRLFGGDPLNILLNQLFYIGLIAAVILAIVMIIRGGIEYMTIDAIASKENGKNRVKAALGGLVLAFSAILILNTINPGLTSLKIVFPKLGQISQVEVEADIYSAVSSFEGLSPTELQEILASGKIPADISPAGQKILAQALSAINNMNTGSIDNTNGGRLACAAAVNKIVELATGQQVGGGLSTAAMYQSLQNNSRFVLVPGGIGAAQPGDIIISPTSGGSTGHVGIVATSGGNQIISNSSSQRKVLQNHSASSWDNYYGSKKGLSTYIYRPL